MLLLLLLFIGNGLNVYLLAEKPYRITILEVHVQDSFHLPHQDGRQIPHTHCCTVYTMPRTYLNSRDDTQIAKTTGYTDATLGQDRVLSAKLVFCFKAMYMYVLCYRHWAIIDFLKKIKNSKTLAVLFKEIGRGGWESSGQLLF